MGLGSVRIALITACWRRSALTELFWEWTQHLRHWWRKHDVAAFASVSEASHAALARQFGAEVAWANNEPLGGKWNVACQAARGADAVLVMPSDDFFDEIVARALLSRTWLDGLVGLKDLYFLHARTGDLMFYPGRSKLWPVMPARLIGANVLEGWGWKLWPDERRQGLDGDIPECQMHLLSLQDGGCLVDIKTDESMTPWEKLGKLRAAPDLVLDTLPSDIRSGLGRMRAAA